MTSDFTPTDSLRYLYDEMPTDEALAFERWLLDHPDARAEMRQMQASIDRMKSERHNPSPTSIRIILDHSRSGSAELV